MPRSRVRETPLGSARERPSRGKFVVTNKVQATSGLVAIVSLPPAYNSTAPIHENGHLKQAMQQFADAQNGVEGATFSLAVGSLECAWAEMAPSICDVSRQLLNKFADGIKTRVQDDPEFVAEYTALPERVPVSGQPARGFCALMAKPLGIIPIPDTAELVESLGAIEHTLDCNIYATIPSLLEACIAGFPSKNPLVQGIRILGIEVEEGEPVTEVGFSQQIGMAAAIVRQPLLGREYMARGVKRLLDGLDKELKAAMAESPNDEHLQTLSHNLIVCGIFASVHFPDRIALPSLRIFLRQNQAELIRLIHKDPAKLFDRLLEESKRIHREEPIRRVEAFERFICHLQEQGHEITDHDRVMIEVHLPTDTDYSHDDMKKAWDDWITIRDS